MNWFFKKIYAQYERFRREVELRAKDKEYPFASWFPNGDRVVIPLSSGEKSQEVDLSVSSHLYNLGFSVTDYAKGYCEKDGRVFRIGRVLEQARKSVLKKINESTAYTPEEKQENQTDINNFYDSIIKTFISSPHRQAATRSQLLVIISQDIHDIGQMSTGRGWTSCMDLTKTDSRIRDIYCEIESGGLVAYLVQHNDLEIQHPLARILIRRFSNSQGESFAVPENRVYGTDVPGFKQTVENWIKQHQPELPFDSYELQGSSFSDSYSEFEFFGNGNFDASSEGSILEYLEKYPRQDMKFFNALGTKILDNFNLFSSEFLIKIAENMLKNGIILRPFFRKVLIFYPEKISNEFINLIDSKTGSILYSGQFQESVFDYLDNFYNTETREKREKIFNIFDRVAKNIEEELILEIQELETDTSGLSAAMLMEKINRFSGSTVDFGRIVNEIVNYHINNYDNMSVQMSHTLLDSVYMFQMRGNQNTENLVKYYKFLLEKALEKQSSIDGYLLDTLIKSIYDVRGSAQALLPLLEKLFSTPELYSNYYKTSLKSLIYSIKNFKSRENTKPVNNSEFPF